MLEHWGLSLSDAEAGGFSELGQAARRCQRCVSSTDCIRWLKWHGRSGDPPACANIGYFTTLKVRRKIRD
jgi:hypothetical protein